MSIKSVMPSNHLILCYPLLLLPSIFPSIRIFSNELALRIRWPKYWSFRISPSNEYSGLTSFRASLVAQLVKNLSAMQETWLDLWVGKTQFPLVLTGLISLVSKELSRIFSNTIVQKHKFFRLNFLYGPTLTSIHDYWKNHSFDYMDLCWQSDISAF